MKILGEAQATGAQARAWATKQGATAEFIGLIPLYWQLAGVRGVRPEVAYAQAAHETGFGKFGGVIDATYKNPCGLKKPSGGGNFDPAAHMRFPTWAVGVQAHLDHLALYAGAPSYPRHDTADPRHFSVLLGRATDGTVEGLGGKWAPDKDYGKRVAAKAASIMEA